MGRNAGGSGGGSSGGSGRGGSFGGGPTSHGGRQGSFRRSGGNGRQGGSAGGFDLGGLGSFLNRSSGSRGSQGSGGRGPVIPPTGGMGRGPVIPPIIPAAGGYAGQGGPRAQRSMPRTGCATAFIILAVIAVLVFVSIMFSGGFGEPANAGQDITDSTYARTKLTGGEYQNEVHDELGWLNTENVSRGLRGYFDKTGVQPAVYLVNRPDLIGDGQAQLEEAQRIFNEMNLGNNAFLFVYYDDDGTDGDWTIWTGSSAATVMDDEAQQIFADYLEQNWFSDKNEDDVFIDTFTSTADRIMSRTTNANDVAIWIWIALGVVAAGAAVILIMKTRRKHEAERAAETERILKTNINDLQDDPLLDKYKDK